jgi:toxin ParE1/3/4
VLVRPEARAELEKAANWYRSKSLVVMAAFRRVIRRTILQVAERPKSFAEVLPGIRRALTPQFPYAVFFSEEGSAIVILAIKHQAQNPAQWPTEV